MQNKQWRLENAKLAKAYMAGGMPPYQAAQKCGFMRLSYMEDAIRELGNLEPEAPNEENSTPQQPVKASAMRLEQTGEWRNNAFLIKRFAANGDHPEMIRIFAGGRISYIYCTPDDIPLLQTLLRHVTGEQDLLLASFAELTEERNEEAKNALREMQRAEELQKHNEELEQKLRNAEDELIKLRVALSESQNGKPCEDDTYARLHAERELNARLKDKLVEMLLGV